MRNSEKLLVSISMAVSLAFGLQMSSMAVAAHGNGQGTGHGTVTGHLSVAPTFCTFGFSENHSNARIVNIGGHPAMNLNVFDEEANAAAEILGFHGNVKTLQFDTDADVFTSDIDLQVKGHVLLSNSGHTQNYLNVDIPEYVAANPTFATDLGNGFTRVLVVKGVNLGLDTEAGPFDNVIGLWINCDGPVGECTPGSGNCVPNNYNINNIRVNGFPVTSFSTHSDTSSCAYLEQDL